MSMVSSMRGVTGLHALIFFTFWQLTLLFLFTLTRSIYQATISPYTKCAKLILEPKAM